MKQTLKLIAVILLVLCVFLQRAQTVHATVTPIAWWKFDDGSGTAPVDSSGNSITGAFAKATSGTDPTWSTDVPSAISFSDPYSLSFSGLNGVSVTWPSSLNFAAGAPASFSFWYKPTGNGNNSGGYNRLLNWDSNAFDIAGDFGSNTTRDIAYYDGNWNDTGFALTIGTWYHITFTYDGTTERLYVDDADKLDTTIVSRALKTSLVIGNNPGADPGSYENGVNGKIDDFRIYDVALTSTQVSNLTAGSNDPDSAPTTPTPTPTPTPTSSGSSNSSSNTSSSSQSSCASTALTGSPNLYEIDPSQTSATLYFTPVSGADGYTISYGTNASADQYATSFTNTDHSGAVSYTINSLNTNTTYYFKVKGTKECSSSNWSGVLATKTRQSSGLLSQIVNIFTPEKKIDIVASHLASGSTTPTPTPDQTSTQQSGITLDVKVLGGNNKPLVGAEVTLHSKMQTTKTDKNGVAHFTNVEKGEHRLLLSYGDYNGEQQLSVDGTKKEQTLTIQVKLANGMPWGWFIVISLIFICTVGFLIFLLLKKRRKEINFNKKLL